MFHFFLIRHFIFNSSQSLLVVIYFSNYLHCNELSYWLQIHLLKHWNVIQITRPLTAQWQLWDEVDERAESGCVWSLLCLDLELSLPTQKGDNSHIKHFVQNIPHISRRFVLYSCAVYKLASNQWSDLQKSCYFCLLLIVFRDWFSAQSVYIVHISRSDFPQRPLLMS